MMRQQDGSEIELGYDPKREEREWLAQRCGWVVMFILCVAALAGFLGPGPFSSTSVGIAGSELYLEFDQVIRHASPSTLKILCRPESGDEFTLSLDRTFLERAKVHVIQPAPALTMAGGDQHTFVFRQSSGGEQTVWFRFEADTIGQMESRVRLNGDRGVQIQQYVLP